MNSRLIAVESYIDRIEIGKKAIEEYKKEEQSERDAKQRREIMKQVGYVLGLVGLVLYVYLTSKGVHP